MFSSSTYTNRRHLLVSDINEGIILIAGNKQTPRNYTANTFPFRQDSNFLYFAGIDLPDLMLVIDSSTGNSTLYGDDVTVEDAIWTGPQPSLNVWANKSGIEKIEPLAALTTLLKTANKVHYLPPYSHERKIWLAEHLNKKIKEVSEGYSLNLIKAVVKLRSIKSIEETAQIEEALNTSTAKFHIEAMKMAMPGAYEYQIAGKIESSMLMNNCSSAYGIICSVRGEILHNETYNNQLKKGQLLLVDAGAENKMHYASDITRTTPIGGKFNQQQKQIYTIVLEALNKSIESIKPGELYRNIHLNAAKIIATGLKEIGLMKGSVEDAVSAGAHALFFPHGLGHMLGLDVHDMEDLGENNVGYDETVIRSKQFGTAFLRLGKKLQTGNVITVEPGIYFIPGLIQQWKSENRHVDFINYAELEQYKDFGGIRIEDNVFVTQSSSRVLGTPIPKSVEEIENLF